MRIRIELRGTSPLLCHNIALSDPEYNWTKEIKAITSKRKKTEDDLKAIAKYEWFGGLYEGKLIPGIVMPTQNIRKTIVEAAKIYKLGKQVTRSLSFTGMEVPIVYNGPKDLDKLYEDGQYTDRSSVKVGTSRVMRVRPKFPEWALIAEAYLMESVLDLDDLVRIVEIAGQAEGIGDNRVNGFGRFVGKVEVLQ